MTHQDLDDASALPDLRDQIPADVPIDIVGGDGAYDSRQSHAVIAARDAPVAIPPREGAVPWPQNIPGAGWRNEAIKAIVILGRAQWKKQSGYHRKPGGGRWKC